MRLLDLAYLFLACGRLRAASLFPHDISEEHHQEIHSQVPLRGEASSRAAARQNGISVDLFSQLERLARLVDITYCVGTTGISKPFSCVSRCREFPSLELVETWNTGVLLTDSCGYVAVDHGRPRQQRRHASGGTAASGEEPVNRAIIVAFRGTYSISNTVVDLSTIPQEYVPYPEPDDGDGPPREKCANCTVHTGFLASWRSARRLLLPVLKAVKARHPDYPVHLVGHSLGGAVAALAALELRVVLGWTDVVVTTFGEPRIGNRGLAAFVDRVFDVQNEDGEVPDTDLEKRTFRRVTHVDDPVPLLPLSEWGYHSHGGEVYIEKASLAPLPPDLRLCRGDRDPDCSDDTEGGADGHRHQSGTEGLFAEDAAFIESRHFPTRLKLWQLFFAHRDYFWRLGLCVPGGDPADWGRDKYSFPPSLSDEL